MSFQVIGLVFALIGVASTVIWLVLLRSGVRTLKEIRNELRAARETDDG